MLIPSAFPLSLWRTFITTSILLPDLCLKYSLEYQKRASLFQLLPWIPLFVITFLEGQPYSSCLYFQVSNLLSKEKSPHSPKGQISTVTSDICLPAQPTDFTLSSIFLTRISATLEFFCYILRMHVLRRNDGSQPPLQTPGHFPFSISTMAS